MSILQIVETSPSRVRGVVRYLSGVSTQREREDTLKALLSPESLPLRRSSAPPDEEPEPSEDRRSGPSSMIDKVLSGCEKLGLLVWDGDKVALNPELSEEARANGRADTRLPLTLAELAFSESNPSNHDLAKLIAWYLTQDPLNPPYDEKSVIAALRRYPTLDALFGPKNQSYGQFEDWVVYLGFAWAHVSPSPEKKRSITPDPTAYLRRVVGRVFETAGTSRLPASEFLNHCSLICPVLEGGRFRLEVEALGDIKVEADHLSPATSQAWLRLEEEGVLSLISQSDSGGFVVLSDGGARRQVAEVQWVGNRRRSRRREEA
jgi:hypothetical protein